MLWGFTVLPYTSGRTVLLRCACLCNMGAEEVGRHLCSKQMGIFNTNGLI